jgi:hypothetical protein
MSQNPTISKMETTQTAVDWLISQVNSEQYQIAFGQTYISIDLIEQAKHMEMMQIVKAYHKGLFGDIELKDTVFGDEYYKQTYGSNNQI